MDGLSWFDLEGFLLLFLLVFVDSKPCHRVSSSLKLCCRFEVVRWTVMSVLVCYFEVIRVEWLWCFIRSLRSILPDCGQGRWIKWFMRDKLRIQVNFGFRLWQGLRKRILVLERESFGKYAYFLIFNSDGFCGVAELDDVVPDFLHFGILLIDDALEEGSFGMDLNIRQSADI